MKRYSLRENLKKISVDHILFTIIFGLLAFGLFLGDGKQPMIDTLASVAIISMCILAKYYLEKQRSLPTYLTILWGLNLAYFIIRTVFSDNIGYSITITMRMIMGYLLFNLFYEYSKDTYQNYLIRGLILFSIIAIFISFFLLLFPQYAIWLPITNLVYSNYGHNYIASILLIVYPIALNYLLQRKYSKNIFVNIYYVLIVIALFLSFSRGALILTGLYTFFQIGLLHPKFKTKKLILIITIGVLSLISFIFFSYISTLNPKHTTFPLGRFQSQLVKPLLSEEGRLKYWKQALDGFKLHPLFGNGPGTFYLQSKKFQRKPNEYSWFAHNFFLQQLSEIGIVGGLLFLALTYKILFAFIFNAKKSLIFFSVFLLLINSLFDFNLDFLIIWLLLWFMLSINSYEKKL